MMDIGKMIHNAAAAERKETLKNSPQLSLGELILKLEAVKRPRAEVQLDFNRAAPTELSSWRGIYDELALEYVDTKTTTVADLLTELKAGVGKEFEGYKGGEFLMSRQTPVWVANYGQSGISDYKGEEYASVGIVDVFWTGAEVLLMTAQCPT